MVSSSASVGTTGSGLLLRGNTRDARVLVTSDCFDENCSNLANIDSKGPVYKP